MPSVMFSTWILSEFLPLHDVNSLWFFDIIRKLTLYLFLGIFVAVQLYLLAKLIQLNVPDLNDKITTSNGDWLNRTKIS